MKHSHNHFIRISLTALLMLTGHQALASLEYSVGTGAHANATQFTPINLHGWRLEPSLATAESDPARALTSTATEEVEVGAGIFKRPEVSKEVHFYYGARMGRTQHKALLVREDKNIADHPHGYFVTPALGIQFDPTPQLSLTVDFGPEYVGHVNTNNELEWERSRRTNVTFTYSFSL